MKVIRGDMLMNSDGYMHEISDARTYNRFCAHDWVHWVHNELSWYVGDDVIPRITWNSRKLER